MDSTKRSKQSQRLLQKANPHYIYLAQTARTVCRYPFLYLILKCTSGPKLFHMDWSKILNFCPEITIGSVQCCVECTFTLLRCIPLPKLKVFFFDKGEYFLHNCRSCYYFYFKNFYRQLLKVALVNSY